MQMSKDPIRKPQFVLRPLTVAVAFGVMGGGGTSVFAQEYTIEEIIVTATRRNESVQDVPISIDVLSESMLENNGVGDLEDFAHLIPSLPACLTRRCQRNYNVYLVGSETAFPWQVL